MDKNKLLVVLLSSFLILIALLGIFYLRSNSGAKKEVTQDTQIQEVPFEYEVVSVSEIGLVLRGEMGEVVLPKDSNVKVFTLDETPTGFSALSVGQKVKVKIIPGEAAWITIAE